jgi:predicted transposase YbfD/YdcC
MLSLKGTIVTVDALNCQREIAQKIVDQGGDYALALKGSQGTLFADVITYFDDPASKTSTAKPVVERDHGRIETRTATVSTDIEWLQDDHQWPGLTAIGKVVRTREITTKTTTGTAYRCISKAAVAPRSASAAIPTTAARSLPRWCSASCWISGTGRSPPSCGRANTADVTALLPVARDCAAASGWSGPVSSPTAA